MIALEEQLNFIQHVQELRGPCTDAFFRFMHWFDTGEYLSALNAFIWIGLSWRWGARLGYLFIANGILNHVMKVAFAMPRPFMVDPAFGLIHAGSYGFPSGAAQMSALLAALLIYVWKSPWAWPCGIFYFLLISFSRIYLGVHFPIDILGGCVLGLLLFALFWRYHRPIEKFAAETPNVALPAAIALFFFFFAILSTSDDYLLVIGVVISLGIYLSRKYDLYLSNRRTLGVRMYHGLVAIGGSFLIGLGIMNLFGLEGTRMLAIYALSAGWVSLFASPFCRRATL